MENINRIISLKGILLMIMGSVACLSVFMLSGCAWLHLGETCLVKDGKPCADIVITDKPPRMVKLAAAELQAYIEKISGAKLAITNAPGSDVPAHIYVGPERGNRQAQNLGRGLEARRVQDGVGRKLAGLAGARQRLHSSDAFL